MEEFKSDSVTVKIERKKDCIITLHIQASKDLCEKAKELAFQEVQKNVSMPGFRKGNAPKEYVLEKHQSDIHAWWQKKIGDLSFIEAEKLIKIFPLGRDTKIDFFLKNFSEEGAELTFTFEAEPLVPTIDKEKFHLKEISKREIKEKDVDELIRQSRFFFGKWKEVQKPIQTGDYVILDLESLESKTKVFQDTRFEIIKGSIADWMLDLLIGAKKGDVIEGTSRPNEDDPSNIKEKFEPKKVRITVKKIEEVELPDLNDDFAKLLKTENVEDLRKKMKENLIMEQKQQEIRQKGEQVNIFLIENYPFELPKSLLDAEIKVRKEKILKNKKIKENLEKASQDTKDHFEKAIKQESEAALILFYHSRKIVLDNKLMPTKEEIQKEAERITIHNTPLDQKPDIKHIPEKTKAFALSRLYLKKMQEYILK